MNHEYENTVGNNETFNVRKPGVTQTQMRNLRQSKNHHIVDLHGLKFIEAKSVLDQAISSKFKTLKIIHGKGSHSENMKPVIKNMVFHNLSDHPRVIAFCSAKSNDGGVGATYVLLKGGS